MIEGLGQLSIQAIELCNTPIISIHLGETQIWPSSGPSYYWVLTNPTPVYSSGSTVYANGNNSVSFSCRWEKYQTGGSGIPVDSSVVTATPSVPTYFTLTGNSLKFNKTSYATTSVSSGYKSVTLTYQGQTCDASFNFQGNTYTTTSQISAIIPTVSTFDASGGIGSYTGGYVTDGKSWTSGAFEQVGTPYKAAFTGGSNDSYGVATHSQNSDFEGTIVPTSNEISIPSLYKTAVAAGSYTFYTKTYNGQSTSVTVNQVANRKFENHTVKFYNNSNDVEIEYDASVSASSGSLVFYIKDTVDSSWTAVPTPTSTTSTISTSYYSVTHSAATNGGCVGSIYQSGTLTTVNISQNSTTSQRVSTITISYNNTSYGFAITQAAGEVTYTISLSPTSATITNGDASTGYINVTTQDPSWGVTASSSPSGSYFSATKYSNNQIKWTMAANDSSTSRAGYITATCKDASAYATIYQNAGYVIYVLGDNSRTVSNTGSGVYVNVISTYGNNAVPVSYSISNSSFCHFDSSTYAGQTGQYNFLFNFDTNASTSPRNTTITFTQSNSNKTTSVFFTQEAAAGDIEGVTTKAKYGNWILGTIKNGTTTINNVTYDIVGICIVNHNAITSAQTVQMDVTVQRQKNLGDVTQGAAAKAFNNITQNIAANSTISIGGNTYYGAWVTLPNTAFTNGEWVTASGSLVLTTVPGQQLLLGNIDQVYPTA